MIRTSREQAAACLSTKVEGGGGTKTAISCRFVCLFAPLFSQRETACNLIPDTEVGEYREVKDRGDGRSFLAQRDNKEIASPSRRCKASNDCLVKRAHQILPVDIIVKRNGRFWTTEPLFPSREFTIR